MSDFAWPPETRAAMTAEARHLALRDALAQRFSDLDQDRAGLPHVPLARQRLAGDYLARADDLMGVVGVHMAAAYVAGFDDAMDEWRGQGGIGMEREMRAG